MIKGLLRITRHRAVYCFDYYHETVFGYVRLLTLIKITGAMYNITCMLMQAFNFKCEGKVAEYNDYDG